MCLQPVLSASASRVVFPISGSRHNDVAGGHMQTDFTLNEEGRLDATTRWWTNVKLYGFTGSATIVLTDRDGFALWASTAHTHGVDGEWVGDDDRQESWREFVPAEVIRRVRGYAIIQKHDPHWRKFDAEDIVQRIQNLQGILDWFRSDEGQLAIKAAIVIATVAA